MKQWKRGPGWQRKDLTQGSNYILIGKVHRRAHGFSPAVSLMDMRPWLPSSGKNHVRVSAASQGSATIQVCWLAGGGLEAEQGEDIPVERRA